MIRVSSVRHNSPWYNHAFFKLISLTTCIYQKTPLLPTHVPWEAVTTLCSMLIRRTRNTRPESVAWPRNLEYRWTVVLWCRRWSHAVTIWPRSLWTLSTVKLWTTGEDLLENMVGTHCQIPQTNFFSRPLYFAFYHWQTAIAKSSWKHIKVG